MLITTIKFGLLNFLKNWQILTKPDVLPKGNRIQTCINTILAIECDVIHHPEKEWQLVTFSYIFTYNLKNRFQ